MYVSILLLGSTKDIIQHMEKEGKDVLKNFVLHFIIILIGKYHIDDRLQFHNDCFKYTASDLSTVLMN